MGVRAGQRVRAAARLLKDRPDDLSQVERDNPPRGGEVIDELEAAPTWHQWGGRVEGGKAAVGVTDRDPQCAAPGRPSRIPAADSDSHRSEGVHDGVRHQLGHDDKGPVQ